MFAKRSPSTGSRGPQFLPLAPPPQQQFEFLPLSLLRWTISLNLHVAQSKVELIHDHDVIANAFRGYKNGFYRFAPPRRLCASESLRFESRVAMCFCASLSLEHSSNLVVAVASCLVAHKRYEFLEYFDTVEEKDVWLRSMRDLFQRCKREASQRQSQLHHAVGQNIAPKIGGSEAVGVCPASLSSSTRLREPDGQRGSRLSSSQLPRGADARPSCADDLQTHRLLQSVGLLDERSTPKVQPSGPQHIHSSEFASVKLRADDGEKGSKGCGHVEYGLEGCPRENTSPGLPHTFATSTNAVRGGEQFSSGAKPKVLHPAVAALQGPAQSITMEEMLGVARLPQAGDVTPVFLLPISRHQADVYHQALLSRRQGDLQLEGMAASLRKFFWTPGMANTSGLDCAPRSVKRKADTPGDAFEEDWDHGSKELRANGNTIAGATTPPRSLVAQPETLQACSHDVALAAKSWQRGSEHHPCRAGHESIAQNKHRKITPILTPLISGKPTVSCSSTMEQTSKDTVRIADCNFLRSGAGASSHMTAKEPLPSATCSSNAEEDDDNLNELLDNDLLGLLTDGPLGTSGEPSLEGSGEVEKSIVDDTCSDIIRLADDVNLWESFFAADNVHSETTTVEI